MWKDIVCIVFVCVTANHLGLIGAVIGVFFKKRRTLPIISCPRCLTWWTTMAYGAILTATHRFGSNPSDVIYWLAISFLASYLALWLELAEGVIDKLYDYVYGKIYPTADTTDSDAECS